MSNYLLYETIDVITCPCPKGAPQPHGDLLFKVADASFPNCTTIFPVKDLEQVPLFTILMKMYYMILQDSPPT